HVSAGVVLTDAEAIRHVLGQDGPHAIIGAPLGELPPEEEPETPGMTSEEPRDGIAGIHFRAGRRGIRDGAAHGVRVLSRTASSRRNVTPIVATTPENA